MKRKLSRLALLSFFLGSAAYASFSIPWNTVDGGGGSSTGTAQGGAVLNVRGTIGQFDAHAGGASGGGFNLNGGYWAQVTVTGNPAGPALTIMPQAGGSAVLQWQADATGWQVQTSSTLDTWTNLGAVITGAGTRPITPAQGVPKQFYRLVLP